MFVLTSMREKQRCKMRRLRLRFFVSEYWKITVARSDFIYKGEFMMLSIQEMEVNSKGRVVGYAQGAKAYTSKLLAMGLTKGAEFTITRVAPLGDPCEFNIKGYALTGTKQRVGNWPGVTVEKKSGSFSCKGREITMVDLPGIYSLSATSLDEEIARDYVISGEADLIVNIVDASNLERNLYLTVQLLEMKVPVVIALNMMDIAKQRKIKIDVNKLEEFLGCPVLPIVANKNQGIEELKEVMIEAAGVGKLPSTFVKYPSEIEKAIAELIPAVEKPAMEKGIDSRWLAVKLLEDDEMAINMVDDSARTALQEAEKRIEATLGDDPDILLADGRYGFINGI